MNNPAFTGLAITISRYNDFRDDIGWIARLEFYPHVQGRGAEPEDALKALRESWLSATTIATQNDTYHLRQINNDNEDILMGKYETLYDALNAIGTITLADDDMWYITHQNRLITQRTPGAHFLGVAKNPVADPTEE